MVMKQPKDELLRIHLNPEVDVKVTLGVCMSEILRSSVPELPFEDEKMKIFFELANKAYEFLPSMSGRAYAKALTILRKVAYHNAHRIMLDEDMYELVREMFQLFLDGIRSDHPDIVRLRMEYIMSQTILDCEDCGDLVIDLIVILLPRMKKENQNAHPLAFKMAKNVFEKCDNMITKYILDATKRSGIHVEHYNSIVASFCQNATGYGFTVKTTQLATPESTPQNGPSLGVDQPLDSKNSHSQSEKKNITTHPFENLPTKTPYELRKRRLHVIPPMALSPLPTNVSLKGEAKLGRASDRQCRKKDVKNSGEDVEEVAVDTLKPGEVGETALENYVRTSDSTPEDLPSRGKRIWKPNNLMKPEEGYTHIWMNGPSSRKVKKGNADLTLDSKNVTEDITLMMSSPLSSSAEFQLGQVSVQQHRKKDVKDSAEESQTLPSLSANVSSDEEGQLEKVHDQQDQKNYVNAAGEASGSTSRSRSSKLKATPGKPSNQETKREYTPPAQEVSDNGGRLGPELVGKKIQVFWEKDEEFYEGTVTSYNHRNKKHRVDYDDGDRENLDLMNEFWLYLD